MPATRNRPTRGVIATPHALASSAGRRALEAGGSAVDAAVSAAAVLAVVYPHMCSIGGDLFALVREPSGRIFTVDASGAAAAGIDAAGQIDGASMPLTGPMTVTVPGSVSGWDALVALGGRRSFRDALASAAEVAAGGVPVSRSLAADLARHARSLATDPGMRDVFFRGGRPLSEGATLYQEALAASLSDLMGNGPAALYSGKLGERFVTGLRRLGSPLAPSDLSTHRADWVEPVVGRYGDWRILTSPPGSQGFVLLEVLAAADRLGLDLDPAGTAAPVLARLFVLTSRDRDRYLADPRRTVVPVERLLSDGHIDELTRLAGIGPVETSPGIPRSGGDTVAVVAADADGWAVSLIQSIFHSFGAGILEPATGIVCQNRGASFSLDPAHPNALAGGKRPAHTLMPVMATSTDGSLAVVAGTMGGLAQPQIHAQVLARLRAGTSPQDSVAAPRWVLGGADIGSPTDVLFAEASLDEGFERRMADTRMTLIRLPAGGDEVGHASVLRLDGDAMRGGVDPRSDGSVERT